MQQTTDTALAATHDKMLVGPRFSFRRFPSATAGPALVLAGALASGCSEGAATSLLPGLDAGLVPDAGPADTGLADLPRAQAFELKDPEDIGFGPVTLGETAVVRAEFARPVQVLTLPPSIEAQLEGSVLTLSFTPEVSGLVSGALEVSGRRVPITGRGDLHPVRLLTTPLSLDDLAPEECTTATVGIANAGLANARFPTVEVQASASASARWLRYNPQRVLPPLEEHLALLEVCGLQPGRLEVRFLLSGNSIAALLGRVRGPELSPRGPILLPPQVLSLPRVSTATLSNPGRQPLRLTNIRAVGADADAIEVLSADLVIAPGREATVDLRVTPRRLGPLEARLEAQTNQADELRASIPVRGRALGLNCAVHPDRPALSVGTTGSRWHEADWTFVNQSFARCAVLAPDRPSGLPPQIGGRAPVGEEWDDNYRIVTVGPRTRAAIPLAFEISSDGPFERNTILLAASEGGTARAIEVKTTGIRRSDGLTMGGFQVPSFDCVSDLTESVSLRLGLVAGSAPVTLLRIDVRSLDHPYLPDQPETPTTLPPGDIRFLELFLNGAAPRVHPVEIEVLYRSGGEERVLRLLRSVDLAFERLEVDEFRQLPALLSDILFVVDGTASMDDLVSVDENLEALATFLQESGVDIQVAVTNADLDEGGRLFATPETSAVLSSSHPDFVQDLVRNTRIARQSTRSQLERPVDAATLALEAWRRMGTLRKEAFLSVIALSDEDDSSPGDAEALNRLFRIKGFRNSNRFGFYSVAGPQSGDHCAGSATALPAPRLRFVSGRTGGFIVSPCNSDWSRNFDEGQRPAGRTRYFLTNLPRPGTVRVVVDGAEMFDQNTDGTINWTYDFGTNSINFSPSATPGPGAQISVRYLVECL